MDLKNLVIIGSSAGGPRILKEIFQNFPVLNAAILVIQHMPKFVNESLRYNLDMLTEMPVSIAQHGDRLNPGNIYLAPSEVHCKFINNQEIQLVKAEKVNYVCPSIDETLKSVSGHNVMRIIGIILTGMGRDGADGMVHIKTIGGTTIAQDEKTSIIFGMPREAINTGSIDWILNPEQIKLKLIELTRKMRD